MDRVIGIDLGTTNSCVSILEGDQPVVIPNRGGYKTTPSVVAVTEAGKRLVGHIAKRQAITNAENTVYAAKRLIGRKWNSPQVKNAILTSSYTIIEGPHGDVRIKLRDKTYSVPEISSMILRYSSDLSPWSAMSLGVISVLLSKAMDSARVEGGLDAALIAEPVPAIQPIGGIFRGFVPKARAGRGAALRLPASARGYAWDRRGSCFRAARPTSQPAVPP